MLARPPLRTPTVHVVGPVADVDGGVEEESGRTILSHRLQGAPHIGRALVEGGAVVGVQEVVVLPQRQCGADEGGLGLSPAGPHCHTTSHHDSARGTVCVRVCVCV